MTLIRTFRRYCIPGLISTLTLMSFSACLFEPPESRIATLDLSAHIATLTGPVPTATITETPEPAPLLSLDPEYSAIIPENTGSQSFSLIPFIDTDPNVTPTLLPSSTPKSAAPVSDPSSGVYAPKGTIPTHPVFKLDQIQPLRDEELTYTVQSGDYLAAIANAYQVPLQAVIDRNELKNPETIQIGQKIILPVITPEHLEIGSTILPDSEIIYGPEPVSAAAFHPDKFLAAYPKNILTGYLEPTPTTPYPTATPDGNTTHEPLPTPVFEARTGIEILEEVALENGVNPRVLIALLEYQSGTILGEKPKLLFNESYIGALGWRTSLDHQLSWAANSLNYGFYQWQLNRINQWILADDTVVAVNSDVNAGTAALQYLFSKLYDREEWLEAIAPSGFRATFENLFGPIDETQLVLSDRPADFPELDLPFANGATAETEPAEDWYFSSGPHYGWANGSPWAAIDFVPGDAIGCSKSEFFVRAAAPGTVIYSRDGLVVVDLDNDNDPRTGWIHLYLHVATHDRASVGTVLKRGDPIGHASCEGGVSSGSHLHFARRYNGQWIPIDAENPMVLSGFEVFSTGEVYDGYLVRGDQIVEAWYYQNDANRIPH